MAAGSLARRYARAVVQIGKQDGNLERLGGELRALAAAMKTSPELVACLTNPALRRAERKKIIEGILDRIGAGLRAKTIVSLLLDRERLAALPDISREVDAMIEAAAGRIKAEVVSAQPLSPMQTTQVTTALERLSGKKVSLEKREDPGLLSGMIAKLGDTVYDGSLRTQLRTMRDELGK
jgi:F-type H+-transporting ATPase subunit delta